MQANDILSIDHVIETAGVQTVFTQFWKVNSYSGPDADSKVISDLMSLFWTAIEDVMAQTTILSCAKMINITTPAKEIVFPALAGTVIDQPHPPHQALRLEVYGKTDPALNYHRNSNHISGIAQQYSDRGRFNDATAMDASLTFFSAPQDTGANGAVLMPQVRQMTDPGTPSDPGPYVAPTFVYHNVSYARLNETFLTLRSRKFELCV